MAYYRKCPYCNANLDPGESCRCQDDERGQDRLCKINALEAGMYIKDVVPNARTKGRIPESMGKFHKIG